MKLNLSGLPLLALCQLAAASPCKPPSSSLTTGLTTADAITEHSTTAESIPIFETNLPSSIATTAQTGTTESVATLETDTVSESATSLEASTASESETLLTESITSTWGASSSQAAPTSERTVSSQATSASETEVDSTTTEMVATPESTTTSDMPIISTTSAEPTTTTSSIPQEPNNVLQNPSFEEATISPWTKVARVGTWGLSTSESRTGAQSVLFSFQDPSAFNAYIRQQIDTSLLQANKMYEFTVYTLATVEASCATRIISCHTGIQNMVGSKLGSSANPGTWQPLKVECTWSQAELDAGAYIRIFLYGSCVKMDWFIDDATFVEAV
ncbi:uncharacterized protein FIESC28_08121 [Fusarium coffeatum]|uniref:CBM-cenC domain-containing protein n=1 Tax=Fusarium coffeatum TaxID=231269 RepID=A0A366R8L9_9HYPO|nr:uncharacterized protein FIESC28_08121 [Fusarium coffeatum]RBR13493.1 hypothetical protein FIESC28_08121 [Fusarium coffeatum]